MGNRNDGERNETSAEIKKSMNSQAYRDMMEFGPKQAQPEGEAKVLAEAYRVFSENGITAGERKKLKAIDDLLEEASIQITKDGSAVITDNNGKSYKAQKSVRNK